MSRARKGLRAPAKKARPRKVNPRGRACLRSHDGPGEICFRPTAAEAEALNAIFGDDGGTPVLVCMSDILRI